MRKFIFFNFILFQFFSAALFAGTDSHIVRKQKIFIKDLFLSGRYFDVIGETRRLQVIHLKKNNQKDYSFFILGNYFLGRQYRSVAFRLTRPGIDFGLNGRILLSQSYLRLGYFTNSYRVLSDIKFKTVSVHERFNLLLRRVEPLLHLNKYKESIQEIEKARKFISGEKLNSLDRDLRGYKKIAYRKPALSIVLSAIIPGLGHIYSGKYLDGFLTLVGVAALVTGAYFSYDAGQIGIACMMITFSVIFYGGNLYSAYNSAFWKNKNLEKAYRKSLYDRYIPEYDPIDDRTRERVFN